MTKQYGFTSEGVQAFLDDVIGDVMEALHETGTYDGDIYITVGGRTIAVPMIPESYEALDGALHDTAEIWETEYNYKEEK